MGVLQGTSVLTTKGVRCLSIYLNLRPSPCKARGTNQMGQEHVTEKLITVLAVM